MRTIGLISILVIACAMSGLYAKKGPMIHRMMQANHAPQAGNQISLAGLGGMGQNNNMFGGMSPTQLGIGMNMNQIKQNLASKLAMTKNMGGYKKLSNQVRGSNQMSRMNGDEQDDVQGIKTGQRRMMRPQHLQNQQQQQQQHYQHQRQQQRKQQRQQQRQQQLQEQQQNAAEETEE